MNLSHSIRFTQPDRLSLTAANAMTLSPALRAKTGENVGHNRILDLRSLGVSTVEDGAKLLGVTCPAHLPTLDVTTHVNLTSDVDSDSALRPMIISTKRVDVFKRWIGISDTLCREEPAFNQLAPAPLRPWNGRSISHPNELSDQERADVAVAGWAYIFGDSSRVADYREIIEQCASPFTAAVYLMDRLNVFATGRLTITGGPAILLANSSELHPPGQIVIQVPCVASIGRLRKVGTGPSIN